MIASMASFTVGSTRETQTSTGLLQTYAPLYTECSKDSSTKKVTLFLDERRVQTSTPVNFMTVPVVLSL